MGGETSRDLSRWITQKNVEELLISDCSPALERALAEDEIWVRWCLVGDVFEAVERAFEDIYQYSSAFQRG